MEGKKNVRFVCLFFESIIHYIEIVLSYEWLTEVKSIVKVLYVSTDGKFSARKVVILFATSCVAATTWQFVE